MTITYVLENSLYVNITNRCTNSCDFCIRNNGDGVGDASNLWLDKEPTKEEIWADIEKRELNSFKEIVFCGYGEPTIRLYDLLYVCKKIKEKSSISIRVNTNGQANLIFGKDVTHELKGFVDVISISLNAKNAEDYDKICHSDYGLLAFKEIIDFAKKCKNYVSSVILSVVDTLPKEDIEECFNISKEIGVEFRVRELI